jgi:hypothetical protein
MPRPTDLLADCFLFRALGPDQIDRLASVAEEQLAYLHGPD